MIEFATLIFICTVAMASIFQVASNSRTTNHLFVGILDSDVIKIIAKLKQRKPPDKIETTHWQFLLLLIMLCSTLPANAYRNQLIVESFAEPDFLKLTVEIESNLKNQIHSEISRSSIFELASTDPTKPKTGRAIKLLPLSINGWIQPHKRNCQLSPWSAFVQQIEGHSILIEPIFDSPTFFAFARPLPINVTTRKSKQSSIFFG